ncbi:FAD-dependent oxidoreductase [Microlunatus sp. GCM10028923]|uniref:FAD-dependent oxidoreductase n=1 Tax=Microlunatus sp. GCM10028923 TaxID=3273400 RepID=UPI00361FCB81
MELKADLAVIGGGLGGISAAMAALEAGCTVVLTEATNWLGGQLTSQLVPLDERLGIERDGANASYRRLRERFRAYYRDHFPLTTEARRDPYLNPGRAWVSPISVEPRVAVACFEALLRPYVSSGRLRLLMRTEPVAVAVHEDRIDGVRVAGDGQEWDLVAEFVIDATELGELLELGGVEHVTGRESQAETGEPSAGSTADPTDMQGATWCFAVDHLEGEDHTIDRPADYAFWRELRPVQHGGLPLFSFRNASAPEGGSSNDWTMAPNRTDDVIDLDHRTPGRIPELWSFRRIASMASFTPGTYRSDISVINCPMNDYYLGPLFGVPDADEHRLAAKALSRSFLYWLQTEAPRPDGGTGWPGLRLRPDVTGTSDGFAAYPYLRESRRIRALKTIVEQEVSAKIRAAAGTLRHADSVGVGDYFWIDRHRTSGGGAGGSDIPTPFEIPLRSLVPQRIRNLLPAAKNIGTTQITNGCYRLHPVEWSIGEAAGALAGHCLQQGTEPHAVAADAAAVTRFQDVLERRGVQLHWDVDQARTVNRVA